MTTEEKKAFLLLNSVIFHYHGLDEDEKRILEEMADQIKGYDELEWAMTFISSDYLTAFARARDFLNSVIGRLDKSERLDYLDKVWRANNHKGYITEMEATAMLRLAKDWQVENELISLIRS